MEIFHYGGLITPQWFDAFPFVRKPFLAFIFVPSHAHQIMFHHPQKYQSDRSNNYGFQFTLKYEAGNSESAEEMCLLHIPSHRPVFHV